MNRKDALKTLMLITGGTVFGEQAFLSGCTVRNRVFSLSASDKTLFNAFGEVIIPASDGSGGALAADVASFAETIVRDFYSEEEQTTFRNALEDLAKNGMSESRLMEFETTKNEPYLMLKQLAVWGWLSSSVAANEAYKYVPVPGQFPTDIAYQKGDKILYPRPGGGMARGFSRYHAEKITSD